MRLIIELDNAQSQPLVQVQNSNSDNPVVQSTASGHTDAGAPKLAEDPGAAVTKIVDTGTSGVGFGAGTNATSAGQAPSI